MGEDGGSFFFFPFFGGGVLISQFIFEMKTRERIYISIMDRYSLRGDLLFLLFKTKPKQIKVFAYS